MEVHNGQERPKVVHSDQQWLMVLSAILYQTEKAIGSELPAFGF